METRPFSFYFSSGPLESYDVVGFRLSRALGRPAEAQIEVRTRTYIEPDELLGEAGRLAFGREAAEHMLDGIVDAVTVVATPEDEDERGFLLQVHLASWMGLLAHEVDCRIFQDLDVKEIVEQVLESFGVGGGQRSFRLLGTYPKRAMCIQYNESALAFLSRLLEEEGITWTSEAQEGGEVLVFEDDSTASDAIEGQPTLPFRHGSGLAPGEDAIVRVTERRRTATGKVVLRDYDFEKPEVDLTASAEVDDDAELEVYDYPGLYTDKAEGARLAEVRLQALQAERSVIDIEATCPRITAGKWLVIDGAPDAIDGEYFVTAATHELRGGVYSARASLVPKTVRYRSPQRTPRPVIDGPQTAEVVAPAGSPAEEIHVDAQGRCKVRFHWDPYGQHDDTATAWMRVAQPQTGGSMIFPRVGWEVIVEFLEGNPDRPLITGRVYNGRFMPPYALPEGKSRTAIQTASSPGGAGRNEIRFEDKAGSEEISIQSQKDTTLATANDKTTSVGVNATKNVGVDATLTVGADQKIQVTNGFQEGVGGSQTVSVGGNRSVEVNAVYGLTSGGTSVSLVSGSQMEMDGSPIDALLSLAAKTATEAAKAEAEKALGALEAAVSAKVGQVMGPIQNLEKKVGEVSAGLEAVSNGDLGAAAGALSSAAGLPGPSAFGASLGGATGAGDGSAAPGGSVARADRGGEAGRGEAGAGREGRGEGGRGGGGRGEGGAGPSGPLDAMVQGAIAQGADRLGEALGLGGGGGGGASEANRAGPEGAVGGNAGGDSATGPGHAINVCSASHAESVGSVKATIAAAGIRTTIKGARSQSIGAARVELVGGTRAESCLAGKTEKAVGLVIVSGAAEDEQVGGSRTTMVGGAILENIGGSHTVAAGAKAMFVGAFHKVDASSAIVFKCGGSEVTIDGGGVTIQSAVVTITAPNITLTKAVSEA